MSIKAECTDCKKSETFDDVKAIYYAKWKILAWSLPSGDPLVICFNCVISKSKPKK